MINKKELFELLFKTQAQIHLTIVITNHEDG